MINVRSAILLTAMGLGPAALPAQASPMPVMGLHQTLPVNVVQVRSHDHRHVDHRRDHRFHGRDDYYDQDDQSGVLFKSFVTGTLFR